MEICGLGHEPRQSAHKVEEHFTGRHLYGLAVVEAVLTGRAILKKGIVVLATETVGNVLRVEADGKAHRAVVLPLKCVGMARKHIYEHSILSADIIGEHLVAVLRYVGSDDIVDFGFLHILHDDAEILRILFMIVAVGAEQFVLTGRNLYVRTVFTGLGIIFLLKTTHNLGIAPPARGVVHQDAGGHLSYIDGSQLVVPGVLGDIGIVILDTRCGKQSECDSQAP